LRFTGGKASGKTTALRAFAEERDLVGVKCLFVSGESTLAGIRQAVANGEYKAVLIDDVERPLNGCPIDIDGLLGIGLDHIVVASMRHPAEVQRDELLAALEAALEVLDNVQGDINPERGYADELEADVSLAVGTARAAIYAVKGGAQ
jgi:hypothetical protein